MPTAWYRLLLFLILLLPLAGHAGDASDFVAANPTTQAKLLDSWAARPDSARLPLLEALQQGRLGNDSNKTPFIENAGTWQAAEGDAQPAQTPRKLRLNNRLRGLLTTAQASHQLLAAEPAVRLAAAQLLQKSAKPAQLELLSARVASESDDNVRAALALALANLQLIDPDPAIRLAAVRLLGDTGEPLARTRLEALLAEGAETDAEVRTAAETSLAQVKRRLLVGELLGQAFSGLSLGSILLLAALGLAITFGLLGVINMAHGEMLMLGAYATYLVQILFQRFAPEALALYPLVALPVAFCVTAAIGMALERTVIRFLYGRPLETLLATFGLSLVLQQAVRSVFGPTNREVGTPAWMSGAFELGGLTITMNRLVIILFAFLVIAALMAAFRYTSLGLRMRAVTQNRRMAAAMGIRTPWIDALTFGLGSGVAGMAGVALSQIDNVSPNLGQGYIIDSFMVVVFGGVGNLWGTVISALTLGVANKFLEPLAGAVLGKIVVLLALILFIQRKPRGLFPVKGRFVES
ncbi:MAG: urea ABC transporter permease subunit UrtB [Pseudomonas sp.]